LTSRNDDMDSDSGIHINWLRFNIPSIVAILTAAIGITIYISDLKGRVEDLEDTTATRAQLTDKSLDQVQTAISPLNNMPYRVGILEAQALATNLRIDRFTEVITSTMELIRKDVNVLGTKVEVLGTKIDNLAPPEKASLRRRM
jgi:hypothetical protein